MGLFAQALRAVFQARSDILILFAALPPHFHDKVFYVVYTQLREERRRCCDELVLQESRRPFKCGTFGAGEPLPPASLHSPARGVVGVKVPGPAPVSFPGAMP